MKDPEFSVLVGKTLRLIMGGEGDDEMTFFCDDGDVFKLWHYQDCCENVTIESITGELDDLLKSPILVAEYSTDSEGPVKHDYSDSHTWTFYKLATVKGWVDIRWYGESNGYYSEEVTFSQIAQGLLL